MNIKVISGGQTGVDRAALDVAEESGMETGGWCPLGRVAEDGCIPGRYSLTETPTESYSQRTEWNVRDSDATLILTFDTELTGGSRYTEEMTLKWRKPLKIINLNKEPHNDDVIHWLLNNQIITLNIAGPRESTSPNIYAASHRYLQNLFTRIEKFR